LERLMVVKAAERADPEQRQVLKMLAGHLDGAGDDSNGFFKLDHRLHEVIELACQNKYLVNAFSGMHNQCRRLWQLHKSKLDLPLLAPLHAGLARAVADGDGASAIRALDQIILMLDQSIEEIDVLN
jgi:DNA-binding FadR family transcriptional regulator